jgi:predicted PhzF superfamily epimerase YddE/YHI9
MAQPLFVVDAFTDRPFAGNPAAVCLLTRPGDDGWMQRVAAEMNLSETAFLGPEAAGHRLRWFTPAAEVDLCGHATLAAAHVLWETGREPPGKTIRFHTRSGVLAAEPAGRWIELDFPALPVRPCEPPAGLVEGLGAVPWAIGQSRFDYLCEFDGEEAVRGLRPDFGRLATVRTRGVIVTSRAAGPKYDFVSRFFAPALGVPEDPVCGSAHCTLAPYWGQRLGKTELLGHQVSPRGGEVRVALRGDRVGLGGRAVTVVRGELAAD